MQEVTPQEAAAQLRAAANATNKAARKALEDAGLVTKAIMRRQAMLAAGGDRRLRNLKGAGVLAADWTVTGRAGSYTAMMIPRGPWRIRDNSYTGGKTRAHVIRPRSAPYLVFKWRGSIQRRTSVNHPGSARGPFWQAGVTEAIPKVVKIVPAEQFKQVASAFLQPGGFRG